MSLVLPATALALVDKLETDKSSVSYSGTVLPGC